MNASSTVAVIIPVCNRPHAVQAALDSVAAQTLAPAQLIVVDDGSTDATPAAVTDWFRQRRLPCPTQLLQQPNAGPAAARNRGADEAGRCALLAFLDSDDLWPPDFLTRMVGLFPSDRSLVACSADALNTGGVQPDKLRSARLFTGAITARLFCGEPPLPSATVVRATAYQQVGGFDPVLLFGEDYDFMLRLSLLGLWGYAPGAPVTRRLHCGENQPAQSRRFHDETLRRARMLEAFAHGQGADTALAHCRWRAHLAHTWYRAGRSLLPLRRIEEARESFAHALAHNPFHLRARWRAALLN